MNKKKFFEEINILGQCRRLNLSLWQCPSFLFLIMGIIIITSDIFTYFIGSHYISDPLLVALIVLILSTVLLIISFFITQSFEKLAEAARMKTEFINIVSHQLHSPLSNLRWAAELLMSGRLGSIEEKQSEYLKIIKENVQRMRELVSDLVIVSRLESANLVLNKNEIFLSDLVNQLIEEFRPLIKAANIEINFTSEKNLPRVLADPLQIKLVIENLLENAINYTKEKGKIVILLEKRGENLYFEISDNGVGIPKKDQKFIFQKFFRSENVLKYQTQGTGLGLYICKAIIEKSNGKIGFKSEENKGSTFWFTLPIVR